LRGLGASLALPMLDAMTPAFARAADQAAESPRRLSFVYFPNGAIMSKWRPDQEGTAFQFTPILEPLAPFREQLLILGGLDSKEALGRPGEQAGEHPRAGSAFLTGVHTNKQTSGSELYAGISVDQVAARELAKHTQLASLELGIESSTLGACESGYSCAYYNTISWRNETTPMPMENQPRAVFERLFGAGTTSTRSLQTGRSREQRSILDFVAEETARLFRDLAPGDRNRVDQYLDAVRDVERRVQMAEEQSSRELPMFERPGGVPPTFAEHIKLLFDLLVLAYQCDLTRVSTLMIGHEMSAYAYPEIGISDPYHPLTHHQGDQAKIAKALEVNVYHAKMFAYFLEKLRSTPDGGGSLLDHTMVLYGGGLSDGNQHIPTDLPIVLAGGSSGRIKGGRHIRFPKGTALTNLYVTLLHQLDIDVDKFGDSTGRLDLTTT
jgi:hypothetical protein